MITSADQSYTREGLFIGRFPPRRIAETSIGPSFAKRVYAVFDTTYGDDDPYSSAPVVSGENPALVIIKWRLLRKLCAMKVEIFVETLNGAKKCYTFD